MPPAKPTYVQLHDVATTDLLGVLNNQHVRRHLVTHDMFDVDTADAWVRDKQAMNLRDDCRIRGIRVGDRFAGWCGVQALDGEVELAIVLDPGHWGMGHQVFRDVMDWARELGHETVLIHLLDTRPEYRFLRRIATQMTVTRHMGRTFTTYRLPVR